MEKKSDFPAVSFFCGSFNTITLKDTARETELFFHMFSKTMGKSAMKYQSNVSLLQVNLY